MIQFIEWQVPGYKSRTIENARADATIAIAIHFNTAGEICTRKAVEQMKKMYIQIDGHSFLSQSQIRVAASALSNGLFKIKTLNIAGNGIYTFHKGITQEKLDKSMFQFLDTVFFLCEYKPELIRSGGQTGIDEAGLKAADKLGIRTLCVAPKGWLFRDINGKDIADEKLFKARFK